MVKIQTVIGLVLLIGLTGCATNGLYQISQGMSRDQVIDAIGKPNQVRVNGDYEYWYYKPSILLSYYQYQEVTFDNGRVASFVKQGEADTKNYELYGLPNYDTRAGVSMAFPHGNKINSPES